LKQTVAIVGLGLIGGSLGQALRKSKRFRMLGIARRLVPAA
jgi:prephenate dehydrogenase